jgi:hypothetical protein
MALTCCLNKRCDRTYLENLPQCPHCGTSNFFNEDGPVLTKAVDVLIRDLHKEKAEREKRLLQELDNLDKPWYVRWWRKITG